MELYSQLLHSSKSTLLIYSSVRYFRNTLQLYTPPNWLISTVYIFTVQWTFPMALELTESSMEIRGCPWVNCFDFHRGERLRRDVWGERLRGLISPRWEFEGFDFTKGRIRGQTMKAVFPPGSLQSQQTNHSTLPGFLCLVAYRASDTSKGLFHYRPFKTCLNLGYRGLQNLCNNQRSV